MGFADEVKAAFSGLAGAAALELRDVGEESVFDNAHAELHGGPLRLRILRERGQVFASIGPAAWLRDWYDLDLALHAAGAADAANQLIRGGQTSLSELARIIDQYLPRLLMAFEEDEYPGFKARIAVARRDPVLRPLSPD